MFVLFLLIFILGLIYFLSMVFMQYSRISNINLQFGMDVTKLYSDDNIVDRTNCITASIKRCAMTLYKLTSRIS